MLKYLKNFVRGSEALHLMISRVKAEHDADKAKKADCHVTDDDDVTVAAYELFISAIVPKFLKVPAKDAEIFKRVWASYNKALDKASSRSTRITAFGPATISTFPRRSISTSWPGGWNCRMPVMCFRPPSTASSPIMCGTFIPRSRDIACP
ncbi:MAG: hypothetical protein OEL53_05260 [Rhodospirillales bacterium]|nr:hypothetical protein [Rhodospirillales bacterium]